MSLDPENENGDGFHTIEFQAVILAGGAGNRMYPLTEDIPKALLPVGNRPLIAYQLEMLEKAGFHEVIIITRSSTFRLMMRWIEESYKGKLKVQFVQVDGFVGTADALRQAKDLLKSDFFVVSGDLISNVQLHYLADIHRSRDAALTVLLQDIPPEKKDDEKRKKSQNDEDLQQFVGLEMDKDNRLVYFRSASDLDDDFVLPKSFLRRHPSVTFSNKWRDSHLYIMSRWVIELLEREDELSSIQGELIPYLVKHQFDPAFREWRSQTKLAQQASYRMSHAPQQHHDDENYRCYVYMAPSTTYCVRVNTVSSYVQANRDMASGIEFEYTPWTPVKHENYIDEVLKQYPKAQLGGGATLVGDGLKLGDNASIKRSIIGKHCKLGANVKIIDSILMDYVNVEDGCAIQESVLCHNSTVGNKSTLKECRIGTSYSLPSGTEIKNESLSNERK